VRYGEAALHVTHGVPLGLNTGCRMVLAVLRHVDDPALQAGDHRLLHADSPRQLRLGKPALRPEADHARGHLTRECRPVPRLPELRVLTLIPVPT
jgi:hypothetical protein